LVEERKPLARSRRKWEGAIKMDLKEIGWEDVDRIYLAQDKGKWRDVRNMVMNRQIP
jgi:hypothetical protein